MKTAGARDSRTTSSTWRSARPSISRPEVASRIYAVGGVPPTPGSLDDTSRRCRNIDLVLHIESDRMGHLLIPEGVEAERGAVLAELHSYENDPHRPQRCGRVRIIQAIPIATTRSAGRATSSTSSGAISCASTASTTRRRTPCSSSSATSSPKTCAGGWPSCSGTIRRRRRHHRRARSSRRSSASAA